MSPVFSNFSIMNKEYIIKNMVCPRCIDSVREVFDEMQLPVIDFKLGSVTTVKEITPEQKESLKKKLMEQGFELLDDRRAQIINQIKSIIIQEIHYPKETSPINISTLLVNSLHYDYSYLSRLFSAVEGRTIEKFVIAQKVEKVKELLTYGELTLSEIAFRMQYSSSAHLSAQFKKVTGMSPSEFRKLQKQERQTLDEI